MANGDIIIRETWTGAAGIGSDNAWTAIVDSSGSWNPNIPTTAIGSPGGWGPECMRSDHSVAGRAFGQLNIGTTFPDVTVAWEFLVTSSSITTSGINNIFSFKHDSGGSNDLIGRFQLQNNSGTTQIFCFVQFDGTANIVAFPTYTIPQKVRMEFQWNITTASWGVWADNAALASGSISSIALSQFTLTDFQPGGAAIDTAVGTNFVGPVLAYIGPRNAKKWEEAFTTSWVRSEVARSVTSTARPETVRPVGLRPGHNVTVYPQA